MSERETINVGPHQVEIITEIRDADGQRVLTLVAVRLSGRPVRPAVDHHTGDWGLVARHTDDRFAVSVGTGWLQNVAFTSMHYAVDALRTRSGLARLQRIAELETQLSDAHTRVRTATEELRELVGISADDTVSY